MSVIAPMRPTPQLRITRRAARLALELAPPLVVALLVLPFVIAYGKLWPWQPSTIDLQVYVYAVKDMLAGLDIYATKTPFWNLYFIYPPIAAVLMWFLAFGPYVLWQVLWTAGLVLAQQSVLRRCGVPHGWKLALLGVAVVLAVEPIRTTLGYGQVNTLLMALVVADLLPDRPGERRRIPQGTLIGLAAAIKLTPALFVVFLFLVGRRRMALTGIASFVAFTMVGTVFQFRQTIDFWSGLSGGNTRTASPTYAGNQSLLGVFFRLGGSSVVSTLLGLAVSGLVALLATVVAAHWWRQGQQVFAVGLVGLATCLASPLSWTHHYVWVLPIGVAVLLHGSTRRHPQQSLPPELRAQRRPLPRWVLALVGFWVLWVCACLPLAVLPYGGGRERDFTLLQSLVANLSPVLGVVLVAGLAWQLVSQSRSPGPVRAPAG
jgi:alpha-1,2-mannosyltransferase